MIRTLAYLMAREQDTDQTEAFIQAAKTGDNYFIAGALKAGISPDVKDDNGNTALICAAASNHLSTVKLLARKGAALDVQNQDGASALSQALGDGNIRMIKSLLLAGAGTEGLGKQADLDLVHEILQASLENYVIRNSPRRTC